MSLLTLQKLLEKHKLSKTDKTRLQTEFSLTKLKIEYTISRLKKEKISFYKALVKYAGLERFTQKLTKQQKEKLKQKTKNITIQKITEEKVANLTKELFLKSDYTKHICENRDEKNNKNKKRKCFDYDIWNNEGASLHFTNAVIPKNPFSDSEIIKRKKELQTIAKDIKDNHLEIQYVFSLSWMWNLKKFQKLMPKQFNKSLKEYRQHEFYSLGHWGQFYRYDGSLNEKRVEQFKKNWKFPLKILLGKCSVKTFVEFQLKNN